MVTKTREQTYTLSIKEQLNCHQEMTLKHSSMASYSELETLKSERLLKARQKMVGDLKVNFSKGFLL